MVELTPDVSELALGPQVMHAIHRRSRDYCLVRSPLAEQTGGISLCFPLTILEQILPKLTGQSCSTTGRRVQ